MEAAAAAVNKMQRLDDLIAKLQAKVRLNDNLSESLHIY